MRSRSHDIAMAELYRSDPALAVEVINSILADGDPGELASVLRQLALLFEGMEGGAMALRMRDPGMLRHLLRLQNTLNILR